MARKSSKTAHVMNLLAGEESESSKSEAAKENLAASLNTDSSETIKELTVLAHQASIQTQDGPMSPSPISIIDMSSNAPDPVSELIRQQLEEGEGIATDTTESADINNDLPLVLTASDVKVYTSPTADVNDLDHEIYKSEDNADLDKTILSNNAESDSDEAISADTISEENEESLSLKIASIEESSSKPDDISASKETSSQNPAVSDSKANQKSPAPKAPAYQYLNIMESVVKSMVDYYVDKFDTCTCGRCIADITALTLTKLPPKYIVVESNSASPLLNFYLNRYSQQVLVELTKSCSIVKQNPHH